MKFLLFLYGVSVLVYFAVLMNIRLVLSRLKEKYHYIAPKRRKRETLREFLLDFFAGFVPGLRVLYVLLLISGGIVLTDELKQQSGGEPDGTNQHL